MSLTSHLRDPQSPIGQFIRQHGSQTARIARVTNPQLRSAETINPGFEPWVYSHLGTALDYRIRYFFAVTPSQQLIAYTGASLLPVQISDSGYPMEGPYSLDLIEAFFTRLDAFLETIQPVGRQLEAEVERMLARYCFVLGLFEEVYRSGRYMDGLLMVPAPKESVDELLAIADDSWIDDLCALSRVFYERYHHLLSLPFTLNPTFTGSLDVGGADADLIVDGCLIEIKSSIRARIDAAWLHQLLGYLLLDYEDQQHLRSVAIYMARHGLLLTWPLGDFLRSLTGNNQISLSQLRQEFQALCQQQSRRKRKEPKRIATYARWLEENQCFDLSTVPIPCYRCGEGTIISCSLCGVYVCNDCSEPDENDDSICFDCVAQKCKQGVHYHNTPWKYADTENSRITPSLLRI